jgi:hypothetical protein
MPTPTPGPACHRCATVLSSARIGRRDTCASCGAELRVCRNCAFYSPGAHNDCREPNADRVVDKERSNFCEYFSLVSVGGAAAPAASGGDKARATLDALFRKS